MERLDRVYWFVIRGLSRGGCVGKVRGGGGGREGGREGVREGGREGGSTKFCITGDGVWD